jgi:hypothetical protein
MVDSVAVFPPGFRVPNSSTYSTSGAKLKFFDAGTTTPKTVYSDKDLTTSLGSTVTCDSAGYPTSDGSTKCQVYTGSAAYKVRTTTSADVTIVEHDNCRGALDTSSFGSGASGTWDVPVLTKSADYTVTTADRSTLFQVNCTAADRTMTLPSAVTATDGFVVGFRHAGTANQVIIATVSSQTIAQNTTAGTNMSLEGLGETVWLVSDGANWTVKSYVPRFKGAVGVITIADRVNTPPGSPVQGAKYIVTSGPAGDWATYAEHDVAEYTGNGWVRVTPPTDCGWLGYVQDEDFYYRFTASAWVQVNADAAAMEAATANRLVSADLQHRHPGHIKAWMVMNGSGTPAFIEDYGCTSITDNGTGDYTITFDTAFNAAADYGCIGGNSRTPATTSLFVPPNGGTKTTTTFQINSMSSQDGSKHDSTEIGAAWAGDF